MESIVASPGFLLFYSLIFLPKVSHDLILLCLVEDKGCSIASHLRLQQCDRR